MVVSDFYSLRYPACNAIFLAGCMQDNFWKKLVLIY